MESKFELGDIVEYIPDSCYSVRTRVGSIAVVKGMTVDGRVKVGLISGPPEGWHENEAPSAFYADVWRKIATSL